MISNGLSCTKNQAIDTSYGVCLIRESNIKTKSKLRFLQNRNINSEFSSLYLPFLSGKLQMTN